MVKTKIRIEQDVRITITASSSDNEPFLGGDLLVASAFMNPSASADCRRV
jgi:hypothetical protein